MHIKEFEWDEQNINHIAKHSVKPAEAEEACYFNPLILKGKWKRYFILGKTQGGRYLAVAIELKTNGIVRVITSRDMNRSERRRYIRKG